MAGYVPMVIEAVFYYHEKHERARNVPVLGCVTVGY